jgi:hypothetical protein
MSYAQKAPNRHTKGPIMRINKARLAGASAAVVTAIGGLVALTPSPALAAACTYGGSPVGTTGGTINVSCTGANQYRADALCEENSGARYHAYGAWVSSGWSSARCHEYAWLAGRGFNLR